MGSVDICTLTVQKIYTYFSEISPAQVKYVVPMSLQLYSVWINLSHMRRMPGGEVSGRRSLEQLGRSAPVSQAGQKRTAGQVTTG